MNSQLDALLARVTNAFRHTNILMSAEYKHREITDLIIKAQVKRKAYDNARKGTLNWMKSDADARG